MRPLAIVGIILILGGAAIVALRGVSYTKLPTIGSFFQSKAGSELRLSVSLGLPGCQGDSFSGDLAHNSGYATNLITG